jgi:hypothetical protein
MPLAQWNHATTTTAAAYAATGYASGPVQIQGAPSVSSDGIIGHGAPATHRWSFPRARPSRCPVRDEHSEGRCVRDACVTSYESGDCRYASETAPLAGLVCVHDAGWCTELSAHAQVFRLT